MSEDVRVIRARDLTAEEISSLDGACVFDPDSLDQAIFAVLHNEAGEAIAVYDEERLIDHFVREFTSEEEDEEGGAYDMAMDHLGFNLIRSLPYMGPRAPKILTELLDEDLLDPDDEPLQVYTLAGKRWVAL